ncbi:glutamine synthetase family protein [Microbulbifer agarilyticus]|uniref:glutamine synthetase family protein n=1 Tax=Microbulbifer agarilyticus TaxID=260552 RepID=UPI0021BBD882|nr:glutamine synthetase family protein [Microbulbifer agarilyticus]
MDESTELPPAPQEPPVSRASGIPSSSPSSSANGVTRSPQPRQVRSVEDAKHIVDARGLSHVKVGLFDNDGVMRGKYMSREKFFSALDKGFAFCDVVLGWDTQDQLYDNAQYTGWHTGYPDAPVRILPHTCREVPFEDGMLLFLAEFDGAAEAVCPRALLRRVIERCEQAGFSPYAALEYEFFLFDETPDSARAKGYRDLKPFTPGWFGYSMIRNSVHADLYEEILTLAERMDFPIEGLHTETGPGVLEAAITVDQAAAAADKAALFKTFIKVLAERRGLMATFMAKWSNEYPGQSGHIHLSLRNKSDDTSAFFTPGQPHNMSATQRHFLAGQQRLMPELLSMVAPTINSYRRMIPGFWAPTHATWGVENRTAALRVIPGSDKSQRQEYRLGAADANPYLALAVALGSGLYGIEQGWEPGEPVRGNAYEGQHAAELALPATLWDAAQRLRQSSAARSLFGDAFVEHFAASREWEEREYRKHVGEWELQRYFEII